MSDMHTPGELVDIGDYYVSADGRCNLLSDLCLHAGHHVMLVQHRGVKLCAIEEMLYALGYRVTTVSEVGKAILYFVRDRHDLIIAEFDMPGFSGFQLARRIKIDSPATRIVLLTARCQAEVAAYMDARVVDGWLFKPFRLQVLGDMLLRSEKHGTSGLNVAS